MPRFVLLAALLASGCAADFAPANDLGVRDFTPEDRSTGGDDLTVAGDGGGGDLARDQGMPGPDLATPDLSPPPDLTPIACDLGGAPSDGGAARELWAAEVTTGKGLLVARFDPIGGTWSATTQTAQLYDVTLAIAAGEPLVVARRTDSTLAAARYLPCTAGFETLAPITGASSMLRPALLGGAQADLVFRGNGADNHLYHAQMSGATFATPTQLSFLTNVGPAIARVNGTLHVTHVGTTGNQLYDNTATITNAVSALQPASVTGLDGTLHVVFTGTDTNLYWTSLPVGGAWAAPQKLCAANVCTATSDKAPFLALDLTGAPIVAFHGTDAHTYTSRLGGSTWSSPIAADGGETTDVEPAIATGIGTAMAELVYVRKSDGLLRHARLSGGTWGSFATVSTTAVQAIPALASSLP